MIVGVDGRALTQPVAGIARYVREVSHRLSDHLPDTQFIVYSQEDVDVPAGWELRVEPRRRLRRMNSFLWMRSRTASLSRRDGLDAYWANASFAPPLEAPAVSMVYDLVYRLAPDTMRRKNLYQYRGWFARDVRRAAEVLALSQGTSDRLTQHLGVRASAVAAPGVGPPFARPSARNVAAVRTRHGLKRPYLLSVATVEPRKNLHSLMAAFRALAEPGLELALAGGAGWRDAALRESIAATPGVRALGFVEDNDLPGLYAGAEAVVVPSLYEGFGLPALEARACGARLLCSDVPEIREAGGPHAEYAPATADGLRVGLLRVLAASRPAEESLPGWDEPARVLAESLRRVAAGRGFTARRARPQ